MNTSSSNVFSMRPDRRCVGCSILLLDRTNPDDLSQQCRAGHTAATLIAEAMTELRKVRP